MDAAIEARDSMESTLEMPLPDVCQSTSSGSLVCRICQLGATDTEKELVNIGCHCKGTLSLCHRECLVAWANAQQSSVCEICQAQYPGVVSRPASRAHRHQRAQSTRRNMFITCRSRRLWFLLICILLFFATVISAELLHYVKNDYLASYSENVARSPIVRANYNFCFGLILSLLIFCSVLLSAVLIVWLISECFIWPQERRAQIGNRFQITQETEEALGARSAFTVRSSASNPVVGETPAVRVTRRHRTTSL